MYESFCMSSTDSRGADVALWSITSDGSYLRDKDELRGYIQEKITWCAHKHSRAHACMRTLTHRCTHAHQQFLVCRHRYNSLHCAALCNADADTVRYMLNVAPELVRFFYCLYSKINYSRTRLLPRTIWAEMWCILA